MSHPVLVAPVDPECRLSEQEVADLQNKIESAEPGDAIVVGVPVQIYHLVEGFWILAEDLPEMLAVEKDTPKTKHYPAESTFVPPGAKTITDDEDD